MFLRLFHDRQCAVGHVSGDQYLQRVVKTYQRRLIYCEELEVRSTLDVPLFFQQISIANSLPRWKSVRALHNVGAQTRAENKDRDSENVKDIKGNLSPC